MKKPVNPTTHGVIDYILSGAMMAAPALLSMNTKAANTYRGLGAGMMTLDAFTKTRVGLRKIIPFRMHQKLDLSLLGGLTVLALINPIRKDKHAFKFHLAFLAGAIVHYILTDYSNSSKLKTV
jgi:hypothetical protein